MFLRSTNRRKDGKDHRYYSIVENHRLGNGQMIQKTLLYLGEINADQEDSWIKTIDAVEGKEQRQIELFCNKTASVERADGRKQKERSMRLRRVRKLLNRLKEIRTLKSNDRDNLLKKVGAAEKEAGRCAGFFKIHIPRLEDPINETTFYWIINIEESFRTLKGDLAIRPVFH